MYSFRFPKLGLAQISCQLYYIIHVDDNGHLRRFVRANIQGADFADNSVSGWPGWPGWLFPVPGNHEPWHPIEKILDLFLDIDHVVHRLYLVASVKYLQSIEHEIQDNASPKSLRDTTMSLVFLNTTLSKLRTTLQYLRNSVGVLKMNTPELETRHHRDLLLKGLQSQVAKYRSRGSNPPIHDEDHLISPARADRTRLQPHIEEEFEKANWYNPGLKGRLEDLQMILVQRLLDVESAQQRINIALTVVCSALSPFRI